MSIRYIGFWKDPEDPDDTNPDPTDIIDFNWRPNERRQLADYLEKGIECEWVGDYYSFPGVEPRVLGSTNSTDGYWVWPSGLHILVRDYGVILPAEFVQDVSQRQFTVPDKEAVFDRLERMDEEDQDFWVNWVRARKKQLSGEE